MTCQVTSEHVELSAKELVGYRCTGGRHTTTGELCWIPPGHYLRYGDEYHPAQPEKEFGRVRWVFRNHADNHATFWVKCEPHSKREARFRDEAVAPNTPQGEE